MRLALLSAGLVALGLSIAAPAMAADASYTLTIKDHRFNPASLTVPAGQAFSLVVVNNDATAEEFESQDLHVEKVVAGGKHITVHIDGLTKGSYAFVGERHEDTAVGNLFAE